jgi:hypothetical protein
MKTVLFCLLTTLALAAVPALAADNDIRSACESDIKSLCAGVQPGGGRIKQCIKEHRDQLSGSCKQALMEQAQQKGRRNRGRPEPLGETLGK